MRIDIWKLEEELARKPEQRTMQLKGMRLYQCQRCKNLFDDGKDGRGERTKLGKIWVCSDCDKAMTETKRDMREVLSEGT